MRSRCRVLLAFEAVCFNKRVTLLRACYTSKGAELRQSQFTENSKKVKSPFSKVVETGGGGFFAVRLSGEGCRDRGQDYSERQLGL